MNLFEYKKKMNGKFRDTVLAGEAKPPEKVLVEKKSLLDRVRGSSLQITFPFGYSFGVSYDSFCVVLFCLLVVLVAWLLLCLNGNVSPTGFFG